MKENIILQIIIGFFLADFLSGLFHWIEDTYLDYCINIPILKDISKGNEMHHYFPRAILAYSYVEHVINSSILAFIVIFVIFLINKLIIIIVCVAFLIGCNSIEGDDI